MTGFSRFTEDKYPNWLFDKSETVDFDTFQFLVSSQPSPPASFENVAHIDAFTGFSWYPIDEVIADARVLKLRLPFHMKIEPTLFIHRKVYSRESVKEQVRANGDSGSLNNIAPPIVPPQTQSTRQSPVQTTSSTTTVESQKVVSEIPHKQDSTLQTSKQPSTIIEPPKPASTESPSLQAAPQPTKTADSAPSVTQTSKIAELTKFTPVTPSSSISKSTDQIQDPLSSAQPQPKETIPGKAPVVEQATDAKGAIENGAPKRPMVEDDEDGDFDDDSEGLLEEEL